MRGTLAFLTWITVAGAVGGCGGKSACVPGQATACACSDGRSGAQVCGRDGSYGACACDGTGGNGVGGDDGVGDMATSSGPPATSGGDDMATGGGGGGTTGQKRVFVTSAEYTGTIAATICETVAQSANLDGTWVPWMSRSHDSVPHDAINLISGDGPWVLLDGTVAFANHAQLASTPTAPIALTEKMTRLASPDDLVWTGTNTGGVESLADCFDWTMSSYSATYGAATNLAWWTSASDTRYCAELAHVYCFEQ